MIADYCANVEPWLDFESRAIYVEQFRSEWRMFSLVGGTLSFLPALIGVLNFTNALVTSLLSRRQELAMLQSVSMTERQLRRMLTFGGVLYALMTLALTATLGSVVCRAGAALIASTLWFFTCHFTLLPVLLCAPLLFGVTALVPWLGYRSLARRSLAERLREAQ